MPLLPSRNLTPPERMLHPLNLVHLAQRCPFFYHHTMGRQAWANGSFLQATFSSDAAGKNVWSQELGALKNFPQNYVAEGCPQEPARTNLALYSQQFDQASWTKVSVTATADDDDAPDGSTTADRLAAGAANSYVYRQVSATAGEVHTFSVWIKAQSAATVDLAIKLLKASDGSAYATTNITATGSWQRFTVTGTVPAGETAIRPAIGGGSTFSTGEAVHAWGAQLEVGDYVSSYIPTTTGTVTRTADAMRWINSDVFGPLASECTLVTVLDTPYRPSDLVGSENLISINDSDDQNDRLGLYVYNADDNLRGVLKVGGVIYTNLPASDLGDYSAGTLIATALTYSATQVKLFANGVLEFTDGTIAALSSVDRVEVGSSVSSNVRFGGRIYAVMCLDRALTDDEGKALTAGWEALKWL